MEIDWNGLQKISEIEKKSKMVDEIVAGCEPGDPIYLSDCIVRGGADGAIVLMSLAEQEEFAKSEMLTPMMWRLLVIRDEWDNVPNPGDIVYKVTMKPLKKGSGNATKAISSGARNLAKMDGSYSEQFETRRPYIVDEKGCILCSFTDAGYFLHTRGMHSKSNRPMTTQKSPSAEPVLAPDGKMHLVHYYLYKEITAEAYEKLPNRPISKKPKKGYANEVE